VIEIPDGVVIVLADGAGGTSNGARAAQAIVDAVTANPLSLDWAGVLVDLDDPAKLGGGQATAVIATITSTGITGASVGDSGAWLVRAGAITNLTANQRRKPLVGDGCEPVSFSAGPLDGSLVIASDGLFRYAIARDIAFVVERGEPPEEVARRLVELVRLADGSLQDDVAVVVATALVV